MRITVVDSVSLSWQKASALDERTLARIFDTCYAPVFRYIYYHVQHQHMAEYLATEVFLRLLDQLKSRRDPGIQLKTWLFREAYGLVNKHSNGHIRHHEPAALPHIADFAKIPYATQSVSARCEAAPNGISLKCLSVKQRTTFILTCFIGLKGNEVAQILEMPIEAVKTLQQHSLLRLQQCLTTNAFDAAKESFA